MKGRYKMAKIIVPIIYVLLLGGLWFNIINGSEKEKSMVADYVSLAEESVNARLYEQAIEYYHLAAKETPNKKYYIRIKEIYEMFYNEEPEDYVSVAFEDDMLDAAEKYPNDEMFWNTAIKLQLNDNQYKDAYKTAIRAKKRGASGEEIDAYYDKMLYMIDVEYRPYNEFKTALNGYNTVSNGSNQYVIDNKGKELTGKYEYIGILNDNGYGIFNKENEFCMLDGSEIKRARYDKLNIEDSGYYSESSDILPIKSGGIWKYIRKSGETVCEGFEAAGSFYNHKAAAKSNGVWNIINDKGDIQSTSFTDIKLDLYGSYLQNGIVIAQENGKYHFYDEELNKISDFECDDIDICIDEGYIAFMQNNKWGFVDKEGNVVCKPCYEKAKSFSNGYAAVSSDGELWGFINDDLKKVIDEQFIDTYYFNSDETCFISQKEGTYQIMGFMF